MIDYRAKSKSKHPAGTRRRSLRIKWMLLISAAVLVSLLGCALLLFFTVKGSLQRSFADANAVQVESATREMRMLTEQYERSAGQVAKEIQILGMQAQNADRAIDLLLQETQTKDPSLLRVYSIQTATGRQVQYPALASPTDLRESPAYMLVSKNKATSWTDVYRDAATGKMIVTVLVPIMKGNTMDGAVGFDVDLKGFGALRESNERFGNNKLVIYDDQGLIVTSFMPGMEGKNIDPKASGQTEGAVDILKDADEMAQRFGWVADVAAGQNSGIAFDWEGVRYTGAVSFVYSMNWNVVSFTDRQALSQSLLGFLQTSVISIVIGLAIGAMAAFYIATGLLRTINALRRTIAKTAEGDLVSAFVYAGNDEIGDLAASYNRMLSGIRSLIGKVNHSVKAVEETAQEVMLISGENAKSGVEVSRSTAEIASGTAGTSAEVEKSSEAVHRLSREIGTLMAQSGDIERELTESDKHVRQGDAQVSNLEFSYVKLEEAFRQVTGMVAELNAQSQSISSVTKTISGIAEQTNILSINASIEASRAGVHGRGFAVVASEVRQLAEQARQSAKQIQLTIAAVLSQTRQLVEVVGRTEAVNGAQKDAVAQVSGAMKQIHASISQMLGKVGEELATIAAIEAQKGVVVYSIENILSVSEQTAAFSQEIASAAEAQTTSATAVSEHASRLVELVSDLKVDMAKFKVDES